MLDIGLLTIPYHGQTIYYSVIFRYITYYIELERDCNNPEKRPKDQEQRKQLVHKNYINH